MMTIVSTKERPVDRGRRRGRRAIERLGDEVRSARVDRGLSLESVATALGLSPSAVSRIERALVPQVSVVRLSELLAIVGLELSVKAYPGGQPIRDAAHAALLEAFHACLHPGIAWRIEVPLPSAGDPRAWDALVRKSGWRYGVEAETEPRDGQALARRLELKRRDGAVSGVLLVLPDTRRARAFMREAGDYLRPLFPVTGRRALELLAAGADPLGSAIIVIPTTTDTRDPT